MEKPVTHWVYILKLVDDRFYVGSTKDVERRYLEHMEGSGSEWTSVYPPTTIAKTVPCHSLGEALVIEDALTLWTMAYTKYPSCVRGGRWMKEGHEYIYGLTETKRLLLDSSLSKEEVRETLVGIVKWTIPDHSWYWDNLFESYPKMKKNHIFKNMGKVPKIVKRHRKEITSSKK